MKILIFTSHSPFHEHSGAFAGGAEYALRAVAEQLASENHEVHYVTSGLSEEQTHTVNGVEVHFLSTKLRLKSPPHWLKTLGFNIINQGVLASDKLGLGRGRIRRYSCLLAEKLRYAKTPHRSLTFLEELHQNVKFDIVHCYSSPPDVLLALHLKKTFQLPYTVRMGGRFYYNYFKALKGDKKKQLQESLKEAFDLTDFFVFNSNSLLENSKAYFKEMDIDFPHTRSEVLDIGIEVRKTIDLLGKLVPKPKAEKKFRMVCVGKFKEGSKRQDLLVNVLAKIKNGDSHLSIDDLHVDFLGGGDLLDQHINLAKKLKVDSYCTFHSSVPKKQVYEILKNSQLFVFPTDFEGSSKALAEALLAETPVIASDIPPNRELLEPTSCGLLFQNSEEDLLRAIEQAVLNYEEMKSKAKEGHQFVLKKLDPRIQIKKYESLFEAVLQNHGSTT